MRRVLIESWRVLLVALACTSCTGRDIVLGEQRAEQESDAGDRPLPPFFEPKPIAGVASDDSIDDDPSLTSDLRVLYFNSERAGGKGEEDIWFSVRATPTGSWSAPQPASELNSERRETGIALSADGLTIWFSSDRNADDGSLDIFTATRTSREKAFSTPLRVVTLSSADDDLVSAFDAQSGAIYLARREDGDSDYDLFVAQRAGDAFAEPTPLGALNSNEEESDAFPVSREQLLFFTRDEDLMAAARDRENAPFAGEFELAELNSADDDRDAWVSQDLSYIVFSSNRTGAYRLYEARR
jgi:hypothetical protein